MGTIVEVDFYKPTGWAERFYVETTDRWLAIRTVMARYTNGEPKYINYITANLGSNPPSNNSRTLTEVPLPEIFGSKAGGPGKNLQPVHLMRAPTRQDGSVTE
jgi:hypothetical protein